MITLAIDTSTARGTLAVLRDDTVLGETTFSRGTQGDNCFASINSLLHTAQLEPRAIDLYAVGTGPGSFTGIRVGIAAAKGLALPHSRPVIAVPSFDALALTVCRQMPGDCAQMCVLCDARREEVYFALYDRTALRVGECRIGSLESIAEEIHDPIWFVSAEIERLASVIREQFGGFANVCTAPLFPSAAALAWLARQRFAATGSRGDRQIEPIYLREPQYKKV